MIWDAVTNIVPREILLGFRGLPTSSDHGWKPIGHLDGYDEGDDDDDDDDDDGIHPK